MWRKPIMFNAEANLCLWSMGKTQIFSRYFDAMSIKVNSCLRLPQDPQDFL